MIPQTSRLTPFGIFCPPERGHLTRPFRGAGSCGYGEEGEKLRFVVGPESGAGAKSAAILLDDAEGEAAVGSLNSASHAREGNESGNARNRVIHTLRRSIRVRRRTLDQQSAHSPK